MKLRHLLPLLVPLAAFAGEERLPYACDNGSRLDISFFADADGRPQARLHFADDAIALPQVPAAAGVLYRSGDIRLHTRGDDAILEDGKGNQRRCLRGTTPPASAPAAPPATTSSFIDLAGSVTTLGRIALPTDAILTIRIQDTARRGKPLTLAEQRYELNGAQVPIPFAATVDRDLIGKKSRLSVVARIEAGGRLRFSGSAPMTMDGSPVKVQLKPPTPIRR